MRFTYPGFGGKGCIGGFGEERSGGAPMDRQSQVQAAPRLTDDPSA